MTTDKLSKSSLLNIVSFARKMLTAKSLVFILPRDHPLKGNNRNLYFVEKFQRVLFVIDAYRVSRQGMEQMWGSENNSEENLKAYAFYAMNIEEDEV